MRFKNEKNCLKQDIQNVFEKIPYSQAVLIDLMTERNHLENNETSKMFLNKNWWDVSGDVLDLGTPCPFLLGDISFRYFLPAFLLHALQNEHVSPVMDSVLDRLYLPKDEECLEEFKQRYSMYTIEEKRILLKLLKYIRHRCLHKDTELNRRIIERIDFSIENFWSDFE